LHLMPRTGRYWYEAELHRAKGLILEGTTLASSSRRRHGGYQHAEQCLMRAFEIARAQDAKWWELRAALSLAALWRHQGRQREARHILAQTFNWFTEGFETEELRAARECLALN
jgi:predicted ATPase